MSENKNKKCTCHQAHGSLPEDENSLLSDIFDKPSDKVSIAESKKIEEMSLAELQEYAEELGLVPEDNKHSLLKLIKKTISK